VADAGGDAALQKIYTGIELPLVTVLSDMEQAGVAVDTAWHARQSAELARRIVALEQEAHHVAGQPFNPGSPKQIQEILYDKLHLPVLARTPKGVPSTAESVLQDLALDYPLPRLILEHRSLSKLKSSYTDRLPEQMDPRTGRVHTSYHQAVAPLAPVIVRSQPAEHPGTHRRRAAYPSGLHRKAGLCFAGG
jgi:DNA polymerase-1